MRIGKLLHIRHHLLGKFDVIERIAVLIGAPRGKVYLVNIHRGFIDILLRLLLQIFCILPFIRGFIQLGRILRRRFKMGAVGIILQQDLAGFREDAVFVDRIGREQIDRCLPDTVRNRQHRIDVAVPAVEITDDGDINRIRCPDAEHRLFDSVPFFGMSTEKALCIKILALIKQMKRKGIRIPVCLFSTHRFLLKQFWRSLRHLHSGSDFYSHSLRYSIFVSEQNDGMVQVVQNPYNRQYAVYTFYHIMPQLSSLFAILQKFRSFRQFRPCFLCNLTIASRRF